jgi:predicted hydrocarbon binding protein
MAERLEGGRIKGGIIRAHLEWVRQNLPEGAMERVLKRLPADVATEVTSALSASWASFRSLILLDRAIAAESRASTTMRDLGRFSAHQNLSTTYRAFKRTDIHDFFRRSAGLHDQFQDFGREEYEQRGDRSGRIIHRDYTSNSADYCESAAGYYEEAIRLHGAENASVDHKQCLARGARECVFELRW